MSYATYTATETVAMHATTRTELNAPITGGPLANRFNSEGHGLREARFLLDTRWGEVWAWVDTNTTFAR